VLLLPAVLSLMPSAVTEEQAEEELRLSLGLPPRRLTLPAVLQLPGDFHWPAPRLAPCPSRLPGD
jgi:hypothetical protein